MAENITLSVAQEHKESWSKFKAKHPHDASPTIMGLIKKHVSENPEKYVEAKTA